MKNVVGIDISKQLLDVDWLNKPITFDNSKEGINQLIAKLSKLNSLSLVICEASGGYEQKLVHACHISNLPIHVAHANKIRHFAKSKGLLAKTDKLDARVLTEYGKLMNISKDTLHLSENMLKIKQLLKSREQLQGDRKREKCLSDKIDTPAIVDSIDKHVKWLSESIKEIDEQLSELKKDDSIEQSYKLLTFIPGVGVMSAYYLISNLPELGKISNKAIAALVGVVPFNRDSGCYNGKRYIHGGRRKLRETLYMAALTATQFNNELKTFYQRLITEKKPAKVAIVAVLRKLLSMINSVMRRKSVWKENHEISTNIC